MLMARKTHRTRAMKKQLRKLGHANFAHVRYADDFVVLCNGTREQAEIMKQELQQFLENELHLTLSDEKTKITHIDDGFRFLGYDVQRGVVGSGEKFPKLLIPNDAVQTMRAKILAITAPSSCIHSFDAKLKALNQLIRGWAGYYRYAYRGYRAFAKLDYLIFWQLAHWLGRKYRCQLTKVMRRHYRRVKGVMTLTSDTQSLMHMYTVKYCLPLLRTFENPYTTNQPQLDRAEGFALSVWLGNETRPGILDLRPLVLKRDGWACRHCGEAVIESTVELDHIRPVKRFKRPVDANFLENLQALCIPCHKRKSAIRD